MHLPIIQERAIISRDLVQHISLNLQAYRIFKARVAYCKEETIWFLRVRVVIMIYTSRAKALEIIIFCFLVYLLKEMAMSN